MLLLCRSAFKALAYKKYQQVPVYLEWAPADIWDTPPPAPAPATPNAAAGNTSSAATASGAERGTTLPPTSKQAVQQGGAAAAAAAADGDGDGDQVAPVVSIYVKNLNFATTDASLRAHFNKAVVAAGGQLHSAKVRGR